MKAAFGSVLLATLIGMNSTALAAEITDKTSCAELVAAFDAKNMPQVRAFSDYILNTMDRLDAQHTQAGEPGIMSQLSDDGRLRMVPLASVSCRDHPKMTVYNSAAFVYAGIRAMELQLGTAK